MLSLAPAARTLGWLGSTARAGSFCLFWEKTLSLLPTLTSVSGFNAQLGPAVSTATSKLRNPTSAKRRPFRIAPPLGSRPAGRSCTRAHRSGFVTTTGYAPRPRPPCPTLRPAVRRGRIGLYRQGRALDHHRKAIW